MRFPMQGCARVWLVGAFVLAAGTVQLSSVIGCLGECYVDHPALVGEASAGLLHLPDVRLNSWILAWDHRALLSDPSNLFNSNAFWPARNSLTGSEHLLAQALQTLPVRLFGSVGAVLLHQLALVMSFLLLGLTTYLLVYWLTSSLWASFIAGVVSMHMPWRFWELAHVQLLSVQWIPAVLLLVGLVLTGDHRRRILGLLMGLVFLQLTSSYYLAYFLLFAIGILVPIILVRHPTRWRGAVSLGIALAIPLVIFGIISIPYLTAEYTDDPTMYMRGVPYQTLAQAWNEVVPRKWLASVALRDEAMYAIPVLPFALAVAALALSLRSSRAEGTRNRLVTTYTLALWAISIGAFVMCLGTQLSVGDLTVRLPAKWAAGIVPGFEQLRSPRRWAILIGTLIPIITGLGIWLIETTPLPRARYTWMHAVKPASRVAIGLLLVLNLPSFIIPTMKAFPEPERYVPLYDALRVLPDGPVIELPWSTYPLREPDAQSMYLLFSTLHWRPLLNGFTAHKPETFPVIRRIAQDLPSASAIDRLRRLTGLRWIIVRFGWGSYLPPDLWENAVKAGRVHEAYNDGNAAIYEVPVQSDAGVDLERFRESPDDNLTVGLIPREPLDLERGDAGLQVRARPLLGRVLNSQWFRLGIDISNRSTLPWAGLDRRSQGLVVVRYRFAAVTSTYSRGGVSRLDMDIPPNSTVSASVFIVPPRRVGDYRLFLDLVQQLPRGKVLELGARAEIPIRVFRLQANRGSSKPAEEPVADLPVESDGESTGS